MDSVEKVYFIHSTYDFDSGNALSYDETTLLLRSVAKGLAKACPEQAQRLMNMANMETALDAEVDTYLKNIFARLGDRRTVSSMDLQSYCSSHPVISSWLTFCATFPYNAEKVAIQMAAARGTVAEEAKEQLFPSLPLSHPLCSEAAVDSVPRAAVHGDRSDIEIYVAPTENEADKKGKDTEEKSKEKEKGEEEEEEVVEAVVAEELLNYAAPWQPLAALMELEQETPLVYRNDIPEDTFDKNWVHGYSGADGVLRTAAYAGSSILYTSGQYAISLAQTSNPDDEAAPAAWNQRALEEHHHPIRAMDVSSDRKRFATADVVFNSLHGQARLVVWDAATLSPVISTYVGKAEGQGIRSLDFSRDGTLLLALSADLACTVTIYSVATMEVVHSQCLGEEADVRDVRFLGTNNLYAAAGASGMTFYVDEGASLAAGGYRSFEPRKGLLQGAPVDGKQATAICKFDLVDECISGTSSGHLLFWRGRSCIQSVRAHANAISCLSYSPETRTVVSASLDGSVRTFKVIAGADNAAKTSKSGPKLLKVRQLEQTSAFDIIHLDCPSRQIVALSVNGDASKAVIGTSSGDVFEVSLRATLPNGAVEASIEEGEELAAPAADAPQKRFGNDLHGGALASSHWSGGKSGARKITGLVATEGGFLSCGSDGSVRKWACAEGARNKVLTSFTCDSGITTMAASASLVAVALDETGLESRLGLVQVYNLADLKFTCAIEESKGKTIQMMRFSADGNTLLVVTETDGRGSVRIYKQADAAWKQSHEIRIEAAVVALDFHAEGTFIRVCDSADVMHIYVSAKAEDGAEVGTEYFEADVKKKLNGAVWASNTCPTAWDTQGLFVGMDFSHTIPKPKLPPAVVEEEEGSAIVQPGEKEKVVEEVVEEPIPLPELVAKLGITARAQHLLLSTGHHGHITLARYPAVADFQGKEPLCGRRSFKAHLGDIAAIVFLGEAQDRLVTVGKEDGTIIVWKVGYDMDEYEPEPSIIAESSEVEEEALPLDAFGYESAEDEDAFDGERLTAHLTRATKRLDDEGVAVKDWTISVDRGLNDVLGPLAVQTQTPNDELDLEWVYGYAARQTRGSVRYDKEGRIVYPASTFGVVLEKATDAEHEGETKQYLAHAHHDEVSALDVHLPTNRAATGHKGHGSIYVAVWDTATRKVLSRVNVGAVEAVSAIAFTPDGNCLLVACCDASHSIKVVDWRTGHIRATGSGGPKKVLGFAISQAKTPGSIRFLQVGVSNFRFHEYTEGNSQLTTKSGKYGVGAKRETVTCCASLPMGAEGGAEFVVGLANGSMAIISRGERLFSSTQNVIVGGAVTAVICVPGKLAGPDEPPKYSIIFGGCGNRIRMYSHELEVVLDVDLNKPWGALKDKEYKLSALGRVRGIKSLCVDEQARKILYGTSAGEIGEIDILSAADLNDGPLVHAHFKDRLNSLVAHPIRQECLTAGEDKTLRVWNLKTHKMMTQITLPDVCSAAAYAPNGQIIVAGLGGEVRGGEKRTNPRDFDGKVAIVSYLQGVLQIVHIAGDATDAITSVCFSPSGNKLYAGSNDCNIYVYDPLDNFKLVNTLKVHGEGVVSMDMSQTGDYLLSAGADGEIVTWDLTMNAPCSFSEDHWKTTKFYSREGVRGNNSTGVYYPFQSANTVIACGESFDRKLLATGDAFGAVRLFSNPAIQLGAPSKAFHGHTPGGVSRVAFTQEDAFLLSAGRDDRCIMQWRVKKSSVKPYTIPVEEVDSRKVVAAPKVDKVEVPLGNFAETFVIGEVDFTSKLPVALEEDEEITEKSLNLVNTVGMSGDHSSATYSGLGSVVTVTGRVITTLHPNRNKQTNRQYLARTDMIGAVATSSCYRFLAVGASTDGGSLCIINAATGAYVSVLAESIKGGIRAIGFSHDNTLCAVVAGDERHTVYLYSTFNSWKDSLLHWSGESSKADVKFVTFLSGSSHYNFVTGDDNELKWWTVTGRNVLSESCTIRGSELTAIVGLPNMGVLATGHKNGDIFHWSSPTSPAKVGGEADSGPSIESKSNNGLEMKEDVVIVAPPVTALNVSSSGGLITGSSAGIVLWKYWKDSEGFNIASNKSISMAEVTASASNKAYMDLEAGTFPNSVCSDAAGQRLLVALNTNSIYEVAIDSRNSFVVAEGELQVTTTAYCAHPTESHTFITGVSTGLVKVWNLASSAREVTGVLNLEKKPPLALSFINDTTLAVAVDRSDTGGKSGAVFLVELKAPAAVPVTGGRQLAGSNSRELKIIKKIHNIGKGVVTDIKSSPDGKTLACCSGDGSVYFFDPARDYAPAGQAICHQSVSVVSMDWSTCGGFIRAFGPTTKNDQVMKLSFFSYEFGAEEPVTGLKEDVDLDPIKRTVSWASASSPAAFEAAGCHPASYPGVGVAKGEPSVATDLPTVTSITVDARRIVKYLAAGYTDGSVKLFKFPAVPNQFSTLMQAQSSNPVKVCFLSGGAMVSISDTDGSLAVYE